MNPHNLGFRISVKQAFRTFLCSIFALALGSLIAIFPASATAADFVLAGTATNSAYCGFSCAQRYQQLYSASYFTGPTQINEVSFFTALNTSGAVGWSGEGIWQMTLATSDKVVTRQADGTFGYGGLSQYFADNLGSDQQIFDTQTFSGSTVSGQRVSFSGSFNYDPSMGDLLVDIQFVSGTTSRIGFQGGPSSHEWYYKTWDGRVAAIYSFSSNTVADGATCDQYGCLELVTEFQTAAVPEPETYAMMLAGLGLVGGAVRRRRQAKL